MTKVEALYLNNCNNAFPRSYDYPVTYGSLDAYVWPGGYPVFYLTPACDTLCPKCAQMILETNRADALLVALGADMDLYDEDGNRDLDPVLNAMRDEVGPTYDPRDTPYDYDANWEDPDMMCEECNERIPSAYAEPDNE